MVLQASISLLFVLLIVLPPSPTAYFSEYVLEDCYYAEGTFKKNSQYHQDLKLLLGNLSISAPVTGFFKDKIYVNGTVEVATLAMCRGDLELPKDCSSCVEHAVSEIGNLCPYKKNASVFYDHCYLRYGDNDFLGEMEGTPLQAHSIENITKSDREKFYAVREKLLSELLVEATNGTSSPAFFATGEAKVSSDLSVFALLQCTPDLITKQCKICLKYQIDDVPDYAGFSAGFVSIGYGCFLRYENELFYNKPSQPPSPSPSPSPPPPSPSPETSDDSKGNFISKRKIVMVTSVVIGLVMVGILMCGFLLWTKRRNANRSNKVLEKGIDDDKRFGRNVEYLSMKFEDLEVATNHFSEENKIGGGGFGFVYKGILNDQEIAVKRLKDDSLQGQDQLEKEVNLLAGLQHNNLVRLYGYCMERGEMLLVYEYMSNGSLEKHLFDPTPSMGLLDWTSRLNIIDGILKGIQYLHEDSRLKIFHCDLKPENILLDSNMTPKISDFGISRFFDANQTRECTTVNIVGTSGYMAPEYRFFGNFSTKSDIYSLGVMLLEILTGKRWSRQINSCENANNFKSNVIAYWENESFANKMDKNVPEIYNTEQEKILSKILHIALLCVEFDPELRPRISKVRDYIKLSNNSSHISGSSFNAESKIYDSIGSSAATMGSTQNMTNDGVHSMVHMR